MPRCMTIFAMLFSFFVVARVWIDIVCLQVCVQNNGSYISFFFSKCTLSTNWSNKVLDLLDIAQLCFFTSNSGSIGFKYLYLISIFIISNIYIFEEYIMEVKLNLTYSTIVRFFIHIICIDIICNLNSICLTVHLSKQHLSCYLIDLLDIDHL